MNLQVIGYKTGKSLLCIASHICFHISGVCHMDYNPYRRKGTWFRSSKWRRVFL